MKMDQIIPLNDMQLLTEIAIENNSDVFITSIDLLHNLISRDTFPIKNKRIAIKNILEFLRHADKMKTDNNSIISFHTNTLIEFFNRNSYKDYLKLLQELNVMTRVPDDNGVFYTPNKSSSKYRFHNEYCNAELAIFIQYSEKEPIFYQEVKIHKKFSSALVKTEIDFGSAILAEIENCKDNDKLRKRISAIFDIHNKRYVKKGEKVDRIYHSFSNLSRISREHLYVGYKTYNSIDIVNCQPVLLCYFLKKNDQPIDDNYIQDCESGCLYENFVNMTDTFTYFKNGINIREEKTLDRENAKIELYRSIYFRFRESNPVNQKFKELYPLTWQSLKEYSETTTMACILQNIEAEIFNDLVPRRSKYFFTLFDAIYFTSPEDREDLKAQIESKFNLLSLNPTIK